MAFWVINSNFAVDWKFEIINGMALVRSIKHLKFAHKFILFAVDIPASVFAL